VGVLLRVTLGVTVLVAVGPGVVDDQRIAEGARQPDQQRAHQRAGENGQRIDADMGDRARDRQHEQSAMRHL
jgi:hypothetical protein